MPKKTTNSGKVTKTVAVKAKTSLEQAREIVASNRVAIGKLKQLVNNITSTLDLDEDRMAKRIDAAMKSEYGAVNGMINLVVAISNWPVEAGDGANVALNRRILEDKFNLDLLLMEDIGSFRGYHSFATDTLEIKEGKEPDYQNYADYCRIFLEELGVTTNRPTIEPVAWRGREAKASKDAKDELIKMADAIDRYKLQLENK
jgi:hypothetical protein